MGYNIAGLVINQNYDKDIKKLAQDLKWGIEIIEEVNFETASSNWTPDGEFRLHFTDKATMIFFPHDWVEEQNRSSTADTLNYAYSATGMAFYLDLFKAGKLRRSMFEHEGGRFNEEGEPLEIESEHETADGLTFALMDELLCGAFGTIDLGEKSFRCKKIKYLEVPTQEVNDQEVEEALGESQAPRNERSNEPRHDSLVKQAAVNTTNVKPILKPIKKWWQFWK